MKRTLKSIAAQLTEEDIQELVRLKKQGGKKVEVLRKKRDKLAAQLAAVDAEIEKLTGGAATAPAARRRKPGRPAAAKTKAPATRRKKAGRRINFTASVREVFAKAGKPLRASEVVDALPEVGIKVKDVAEMRKRISIVLASQKKSFEQVERGVYQLRDQ